MKRFKILSAALLAACMALATALAEWAMVGVEDPGLVEIAEVGKVAAIVGEDVSVDCVRRVWTSVDVVTTNANVETEYRVTWKHGNTTNVEHYAFAGNAAGRVAAIQANTNLTLLGSGFTTNYTTNVYAIVTNTVRVVDSAVTNTLSVGDFVLPGDLLLETGGNYKANVILEK